MAARTIGWTAAALMGANLSWPAAAHAFDCAKASTVVERAICADGALKRLDDQMAKAYDATRAAAKEKDRKILAQAQRKWLERREQYCEEADLKMAASCAGRMTAARLALFEGKPVSGPGTGSRLIPVFIQQEGSETQYEVDITIMRFVEPRSVGEKLFNAEIDELIEEPPFGPHEQDAAPGVPYSSYVGVTIGYASPGLISATVDSWDYTGGAHGEGGVGNVNVLLEAGRMLAGGDIFPATAFETLNNDCKEQILQQKRARSNGADHSPPDLSYHEKAILESLKSFDAWSFFGDKAVVTFNPYDIGGYAEGSFICTFPMSKLKALAKPGAPLPE